MFTCTDRKYVCMYVLYRYVHVTCRTNANEVNYIKSICYHLSLTTSRTSIGSPEEH